VAGLSRASDLPAHDDGPGLVGLLDDALDVVLESEALVQQADQTWTVIVGR